MEQNAHGEHPHWCESAPRSYPAGFLEARPLAHIQERGHRIRLRNQVETAILPKGRRRLFSAGGAVGRYSSDVASLQRGRWHGLVDQFLSASELRPSYWTSV